MICSLFLLFALKRYLAEVLQGCSSIAMLALRSGFLEDNVGSETNGYGRALFHIFAPWENRKSYIPLHTSATQTRSKQTRPAVT